MPSDPIVQQEYQKRMRHHGIKIRPDIIVHIPFERGVVEGRDEGNFVVSESVSLLEELTCVTKKECFVGDAFMS